MVSRWILFFKVLLRLCSVMSSTVYRNSWCYRFFYNFTTAVLNDGIEFSDFLIDFIQFSFILFCYGSVINLRMHFFVLVFLKIVQIELESFESVVKNVDLLWFNLRVKRFDGLERLLSLIVEVFHHGWKFRSWLSEWLHFDKIAIFKVYNLVVFVDDRRIRCWYQSVGFELLPFGKFKLWCLKLLTSFWNYYFRFM